MTANLKPTCHIHIGAPKTGTTALQKFFSANREGLLKQGLLYPDVHLRGYGHHDLAFLVSGGYPEWATPATVTLTELSDQLKETAAAHKGDLLLSSENFYLLGAPENLLKILDAAGITRAYDVKIIVFLRRQDFAHESWYNQIVKAQGYGHGFEESIDSYFDLWDYAKNLSRWAEVFGCEQIIPAIYPENDTGPHDLVLQFLGLLGLVKEGLNLPSARTNTGINLDILEYQRMVNQLPLATVEKRAFHKELMELTHETRDQGVFREGAYLLADAARRSLLDRYQPSNEALAVMFASHSLSFLPYNPGSIEVIDTLAGLTTSKLSLIHTWLMIKQGADG